MPTFSFYAQLTGTTATISSDLINQGGTVSVHVLNELAQEAGNRPARHRAYVR